ncbi:hypothetical protein EVB81_228 [Rhizobium phage RHph_I46]|uniref:Lipoprotein n=1 Tax=Rhizobium phage RHph_I1_9 TaxID=2509729 RepID=A0A7S5R9Y1_9CAUD|nr:hypothetical protein PP936_gp226 [Rhizobium phage RHph_I1_9]QIG69797.1 hypothetical protein EVB81_228 [Rhizobium phage RHph_I46]QIG71078.1 hypothetical protein EVB92_228 [Rhizobium phage RHph_I9]QIG73663.1 hypothetical protein EVC04_226 [Rhizobium phage RHph_I1_9]QIG76417.1 hypothetical protein EVC25_228 [Rhizobium phage RHph_I34]
MKTLKALVVAGLFALAGCGVNDGVQRGKTSGYSVIYFFDERTGLCFARNGSSSYDGQVLTIAPCTEKVMKAIEEDKEYAG